MNFLIIFVLVLANGVLSDQVRGRIFGGYDAHPSDFKYQVRVFVPSVYLIKSECGGSVIHNKWILTAAHCFHNITPKNATVLLGLGRDHVYTQVRNAIKVIIHKKYFRSRYQRLNDIALIKVEYVKYNNYIRNIPLTPPTSFDGQIVKLAGWGDTGDTTTNTTKLQYTTLKVLNSTECNKHLERNIRKTQFCTFSTTQATCFGDSGGPAIIGHGYTAVQVGILSYGLSVCSPNTPDIFTRISSFLPWIKLKTHLIF